MDLATRAEHAAAWGLLAGAVAYLVVTAARLGLVYYLPEQGAWTARPPTGAIAMDWYYRAAVTLVACLVATGAAFVVTKSPRAARVDLIAGLGFLALAWALVFTVMTLVSAA